MYTQTTLLLIAYYALVSIIICTDAFTTVQITNKLMTATTTALKMVVEIGPTDDDVEPPLPGQMKISEIKAELDMRKVSYTDCFDRDSLELRLNDARRAGKADPSIIDQFNKRNLEANVKGESFEVSDTVLESSVANDGTL